MRRIAYSIIRTYYQELLFGEMRTGDGTVVSIACKVTINRCRRTEDRGSSFVSMQEIALGAIAI